ncbi:related to U2 small nuclear ribonucleoprotein B [Sporisorium reilianum f. sp. reilianum]|uniref:Related to U2 small nuclear ribonucleoprotein B n=1 Tax=Sporisorium reilianum f. sp. reilianum TaxID=72559 RepID=A0A2N8ULD2_9BASI|nr:related to U2 small nuclear ribonucleoprotein B [Sporisorium reilianum f. sp. reilianum]
MAVASTSTSNGTASTAAPSPTLYIKNIEGKIKKPELRAQLHTLFTTYGRILDVVATRAPHMRGQAFVVFESAGVAAAAKRALDGFAFYGRPLHIAYSTGGKSRALLRRELGADAVHEMDLEKSRTMDARREAKRALVSASQDDAAEQEDEEEGGRKRAKLAGEAVVQARNIPNTIEESVLTTLFSAHPGFLALSPTKDAETWSATITFDTDENAHAAQSALLGVQLDPLYTLDLHVS